MTSKTISRSILRAVAIAIGVFVLVYFLYQIRSIILYIGIAAVIALVGRPLVQFFRRRLKIPNQLAVIISLILIFGVIMGILAVFIPIVNQQSENLAKIDFQELRTNLNVLNNQLRNYLGLHQINLIDSLQIKEYFENFDYRSVSFFMSSIFGKMGSVIVGVFAVLFISFFFLKDSNLLLNSILVFSKPGNEDRFERIFNKVKNLLSRYFVGITLQITVLFVLYSILLFSFEIPNAVAIAFICAFLNIVPYIGPIVAGVLMMFFVISDHLGANFSAVILPNTLYILAGYIIVQLIDNIINQPLIFGQSVKSHPLEIFLIILISGLLFGIFGMIIAVPFYTTIKVIAKESLSRYKIVQYLTRDL